MAGKGTSCLYTKALKTRIYIVIYNYIYIIIYNYIYNYTSIIFFIILYYNII